jgi:dTDP-4-dehydrorhamnose reductase
MKIAVFGANGMAGHMLTRYFRERGANVTTVARTDADLLCDVENASSVVEVLTNLIDYDFIVNCVGLLVKDSIDRPDRAAIVNGWFPHFLEHHFKASTTKVVHLSTDCVFDGKEGHYKEKDAHTENNSYGRSKSLGEINNNKDITFRMSIIGPEIKNNGTGLLLWATTTSSTTLNGFVDAWWNGITTLQLAKCVWNYMKTPTLSGVYHLVNNNNFINKYDLLCIINEIYGLNKNIVKSTGPKLANKILVDTRLDRDWDIPEYRIQLKELFEYTRTL